MPETNNFPPAYLLAQLQAKDHAEYLQRYGMAVVPVIAKFGGEILVASATAQVEEGTSTANWTVVIRFPNMALAKKFYDSEEYAPLKDLRISQLTNGGTVVLVDGFDPGNVGTPATAK